MSIAKPVAIVEDYAQAKGLLVIWDAADVPLYAGGSSVLAAKLLRPHESHHLTIEIDVSGSPIRVWHKGKTWADGWPWVADVGVSQLAHTLASADAGMVEIMGDEKRALVERGAWPGLEYYRRGDAIVMWCRACHRGFDSPCSVCNGTLWEPAVYDFKRR